MLYILQNILIKYNTSMICVSLLHYNAMFPFLKDIIYNITFIILYIITVYYNGVTKIKLLIFYHIKIFILGIQLYFHYWIIKNINAFNKIY